MKSIALIALLASVVVADIPGLPECSQDCIGNNFGVCGNLDVECICKNTQLLEGWSCCVSKSCDADGQRAVITFADALCGSYGVTTLPTAASCSATPASTSTAASSTSSATSSVTTSSPASETTETSASSTSGTESESSTAATTASTEASTAAASTASAAAAAPTPMAQQLLGLGLGAAGLLAVL